MRDSGLLNLRYGNYWFSSAKRFAVFCVYLVLRILVLSFPIIFANFISRLDFNSWTSEKTLNYLVILLLVSFAYMFAHWLYQLLVSANVHDFVFRHTLSELQLWLRQKQDFFHKHQEGDLLARLTGDVQTVFLTYLVWTGFVCIDMTVGFLYVTFLFYKLGWIALLPLGIMALAVGAQWLLIRRQTALQKELREAQSQWTQCLLEQTEGFHTLRAFGLEQQRLEAIGPIQERVLIAQDKLARCQAAPTTVRNLMTSILMVSMTALALFLPTIAPAVWLEVILLSTGNLWVFLMIDSVFSERRALKVAYERLYSLAQEAREVDAARSAAAEVSVSSQTVAPTDASEQCPMVTAIALEQLTFQYPSPAVATEARLLESGDPEQGPWCLTISELLLEPGKFILVTGPSGGGKSSLLDLLSGEWPLNSTGIHYRDQWGREIANTCIDGQLARVHQEVLIPSGTLRQMLQEARSQASDTEMLQALEAAGFEAGELQEGLDTVIGERGITLSGGQCQRLQFAQVCLQETRIVLLDDLVSALDRKTESQLIQSLEALRKTRGILLVSHRLRIGPSADEILVLEGGRVLERGSHRELMRQAGWYAQEYQRQHAGGLDE